MGDYKNFLSYFASPCTILHAESNLMNFSLRAPEARALCRCWAHPVGEAQRDWLYLQLKRFSSLSNPEESVWELLRARRMSPKDLAQC